MKTLTFGVFCVFLLLYCHAKQVRYHACMVPRVIEKEVLEKTNHAKLKQLSVLRGPFQTLPAFQTPPESTVRVNVQKCVIKCWTSRYEYAALQRGSECYCANNLDGLVVIDNIFCNSPCAGNCLQDCGGPVALSVYVTGYIKEPEVLFSEEILRRGYMGCYSEQVVESLCDINDLQKPSTSLVTDRMTALLCATFCMSVNHGTNVLSVNMGRDECCCGKHFDQLKTASALKVTPDICTKSCSGIGKIKCFGIQGANKFVTVFHIYPLLSDNEKQTKIRYVDFSNKLWAEPQFPDGVTFEYKTLVPDLMKFLFKNNDKKIAAVIKPLKSESVAVVDLSQSAVNVVDAPPSKLSGVEIGFITFGVILGCIIKVAGIIYFFGKIWKRKHSNKSEQEELQGRGNENNAANPEYQEAPPMTKEKKLNGKPENKSNESETEDQTTSETDDKEPLLPT